MPFLTSSGYEPTGDVIIDVLADGVVWDLSETTTISWALSDGFNNEAWIDRTIAIQNFSDALTVIQQYIDIQFSYVGDFDNPIAAGEAGADLVYTLDNTVSDGTLAYAYFPGPGVFDPNSYVTEGGDIFMNISDATIARTSFEPGSDGFVTIIHEIGHALGLKHPFEKSPGRPSIATINEDYIVDVDWITIMSYTDPFASELEKWDPASPMALDVLSLQYLYGASTQTNAGDTVHSLQNQDYYYTIWDPSGIDVIDVSSMSEGWVVNLPETQWSTVEPTKVGMAAKFSEYSEIIPDMMPTELVWLMGDIEDVIGTAHDDSIRGNAIANFLRGASGRDIISGHAGNDTIDGGEATDTAVYSGSPTSYTVRLSASGVTVTDRRADGDGTDQLINVERLDFGDVIPALGTDLLNLERFGGPAGLAPAALESFIELYIAYFNRAPDAIGLNFWGSRFADGRTLAQIAEQFALSAETQATYPPGTTTQAFVEAVYDNVLGRPADAAGLAFWINKLDTGVFTRDVFILRTLAGAKSELKPELGEDFVNQQLADRKYLEDKTDIGAYFAVIRGMSDVEDAINAMNVFDGTEDSITDAVAAIDTFYADALDPDTGDFLMPLIGVLDDPFAVG